MLHNHKLSIVVLAFASLLFSQAVTAKPKVIKEERSLYQNVFVEDDGDKRCLKFSVKRRTSSQSCMFKSQPKKVVFNYTKFAMSALVFKTKPERVLIIGLGGGTLSNNLLDMYPEIEIDNVEIDPAVVSVAVEYFGFKQTEKVKTHIQDGRIFIKRAQRKRLQYDLIILDAFNGEYIPEHLLTKEFLQESKSLLNENGVLIANTFSSSKLYHHESATYHYVFGDYYSIKKSENVGNRVLVVGHSLLTEDTIAKNAKLLKQPLATFGVDIEETFEYIEFEPSFKSEYRILTDQYSPANLL
ncbi:MAG: spermidine synthase [Colwellia sp.]